MQQIWLTQHEDNQDLIIYMLGWAATPNAICHIPTPGFDVLACYNYTELTPLKAADFARYRRIYLFAWSFGVWVSEQCCRELPLHRAIALNGTPYPVSTQWGMRLRVVLRSMRALAQSGGDNPFREAQPDNNTRYIPTGPFPDRTAQEKVDELLYLSNAAEKDSVAHLQWNRAYIADKDEIFPPARMWDYWKTLGVGFESFHYPFSQPEIVLNELKD